MQVSRVGFKTERQLVVDEDRGLLLVFSMQKRLLRQIPLTQLVQVSTHFIMIPALVASQVTHAGVNSARTVLRVAVM